MEWLEKNVRSDLQQANTSYNESETSNVVRVPDDSTEVKTGGGDGGGRVEDVTIFIRSDTNGQDHELVNHRDSTGGTTWRKKNET